MALDNLKELKIKMGACLRITKELRCYEEELQYERTKTEKMKAAGCDPYDVKQQENVLAEAEMMIPDSKKRLEVALADLHTVVGQFKAIDEAGKSSMETARTAIADAETLLG